MIVAVSCVLNTIQHSKCNFPNATIKRIWADSPLASKSEFLKHVGHESHRPSSPLYCITQEHSYVIKVKFHNLCVPRHIS
jgi:hypothetical protein